ncbi:hypothetical protein [Marinobacter sp.]|uniref:hypothetical protein n=1 Tax=Marinobacter sp. TaxID=50741 RepID=UPI00384B081F
MGILLELSAWGGGAIVTASAVIFAARKLLHLYRPIQISPGYTISSQDGSADTLNVSIVNQSRETQYVTGCSARGVYPISSIIKRFLKKPFIRKRWWNVLRYDVICHDFMVKEPIKLEPFEERSLKRKAFTSKMSLYFTSNFVVEVNLSTHRRFRSKPALIPGVWRKHTARLIYANQSEVQQAAAADR